MLSPQMIRKKQVRSGRGSCLLVIFGIWTCCPGGTPFAALYPFHSGTCRRAAMQTRFAVRSADELDLGESISGKVINITEGVGCTLDIGLDRPGWIHISNFRDQRVNKLSDIISVGTEIKARVTMVNRSVVLSCKDLPMFKLRPLSSFSPDEEVEGTVTSCSEKTAFIAVGAMVDAYLGIDSVQNRPTTTKMKDLFPVGSKIKAKVLKVGKQQLLLTADTKTSEAKSVTGGTPQPKPTKASPTITSSSQSQRPAKNLQIGQAVTGKVVDITEGVGCSVDLGYDKPGWIHISNLREGRVEKVSDVISIGSEIKARVMKVQRSVFLSSKDLPMFNKKPLSDFSKGQEVEGTVMSCTDKAAFIDIGAMLEAYLSAEEAGRPMVKMRDAFDIGQKVKAKILSVDSHQLSLTVRNA